MSKKGKNHETQAADVVSDKVLPAVPEEHDEPASAALVAGDGGDAVSAAGEQHAGEPTGSTGIPDSPSLGDGAGNADTETEDHAEEDLASASLLESEGVSNHAGEGAGEGEGDASGDQLGSLANAGDGDDTGSPGEDGGPGDGGPDQHGQHSGPAVPQGAVDARAAGVGGEAGFSIPSGDVSADVQSRDPNGNSPSDQDPGEHAGGEWTLDRVALCGAVGAYQETLIHGAWLAAKIRGTDPRELETSDAVYDDMAAFVRQIGERATPDVLAQQLVIKRHRKSAEISEPERIALGAFSSVLLGLDRHIVQERERIARENAVAETRQPVPIDETTMELVDAPMATWGGRG